MERWPIGHAFDASELHGAEGFADRYNFNKQFTFDAKYFIDKSPSDETILKKLMKYTGLAQNASIVLNNS